MQNPISASALGDALTSAVGEFGSAMDEIGATVTMSTTTDGAKWYSCKPDKDFDEPIPFVGGRLGESLAAQACWRVCGTYRRALRWVLIVLFSVVVVYGPLNTKIPEPRPKSEVVFSTELADSCQQGNASSTGMTCQAAQLNVWRQFTGLVLQDVAGAQAAREAPCPAANPGANVSSAKPAIEPTGTDGFTCSSCICQKLKRAVGNWANTSALGARCKLPEVLAAVEAHQDFLARVRARTEQLQKLREGAVLAQQLDPGHGKCRGCDMAQCTQGSAAPSRTAAPDTPCGQTTCAPVCRELNKLFVQTGASDCASDMRQSQSTAMTLVGQYTPNAATWASCFSCCATGYEKDGQDSCLTLGEGGGPSRPRCSEATCSQITHFYSDLSELYQQCPSQLPPQLQAAVASASLEQAAIKFFEVNLTAIQLPSETLECVANFTRMLPDELSLLGGFNTSGCQRATEQTTQMMNGFLKVLDVMLQASETHTTLKIITTAIIFMLAFSIWKHYKLGNKALQMKPAEAERINLEFRQSISWMPPPSELSQDPSSSLGGAAFETDVVSKRFCFGRLNFIPLLHDFKRSGRALISSKGGNLATVDELIELSEHPEVHVVPATKSWTVVSDWAQSQLSPMALDVLMHGNTSVNHLVWRRSMLRVCLFILSFSLVAQWKAMGNWPFSSSDDVGIIKQPDPAQSSNETDVFEVVAGYVSDACKGLCSLQQQMNSAGLDTGGLGNGGTGQCEQLCTTIVNSISGLGDTDLQCAVDAMADASGTDESEGSSDDGDSAGRNDSMHSKMRNKLQWHKIITDGFKFLASVFAMRQYHQALKVWHQIHESSRLVVSGWLLLFGAPLLVSFIPWWIVLDFQEAYAEKDLLTVLVGQILGWNIKFSLGLATYTSTFLLGVAFCKSALRAVIVCKLLIPKSAIWTRFFQLIPLMYVILQWPIFAFVGTLAGSKAVWAFLLVFTTNPMTYSAFAGILHQANTATMAHEAVHQVKKVNMLTKLMAVTFLVLEGSSTAAEALQYICRQEQATTGERISWPGGCVWTVLTTPSVIPWGQLQIGGLIAVQVVFKLSSFLVTYYVTLLAIIDQLLIGVFFLWEHDGYMKDDNDVHELSFLFANSLYDIRMRSESLMDSCAHFLKSDRRRINWIIKLEKMKAAFNLLDSSSDGEIELLEFENVLSRLTADGGGVDGTSCTCKACQDWSLFVQAISVDWSRLEEKFHEADTDGGGSICFVEFVGMIEGRKLTDAEVRDVETFEKVMHDSIGKPHVPAELASCKCRTCSMRHLGGISEVEADEGLVRQTRGSMVVRERAASGFSLELDDATNPASTSPAAGSPPRGWKASLS